MKLFAERVLVRQDIVNSHTAKTVWTLDWNVIVQRVRESFDQGFEADEHCYIVPINPEGALCGYRPLIPGETGIMQYSFESRTPEEADYPRSNTWIEVDELAPAQSLSVVLYKSTSIKAPYTPELPAPHVEGQDWEVVALLGNPLTVEELKAYNCKLGQEPMAFSVMCYNQWASKAEGGSRRELTPDGKKITPEMELKTLKDSWSYWRHMVNLKLIK
tara:strand:- start:1085 stop:1735 length:651 start_codon:yes stop_codon:yes gene_type:complete